MPQKHLIDKLAIGNQFLIPVDIENKIIISDIYYDLLCHDPSLILKKKSYLLWEHQLILKEYNYYDINNISKGGIIAGLKFLNAKVKHETTFLACYDGISQTSALAFIYLAANNIIPPLSFEKAIIYFLTKHYALMKISHGLYAFLKQHYPYKKLNEIAHQKWDHLYG